jgi:hypothetical protein
MRTLRSRLGPSQRCPEEGRVPLRVYPAFLQQEKYHPRGRQQVYHHVLQEDTQGLILDPQAHHEEPQDAEEILAISNKYALAEEATLNTREQKKEESGHVDQPSLSRAMTRRRRWIILSTMWRGHDATRSTSQGRVNLKASWIASVSSTPRESIRLKTAIDSRVLQMRCSRRPKRLIKKKSPKNQRTTSPKLIRRSTTSIVSPTPMS